MKNSRTWYVNVAMVVTVFPILLATVGVSAGFSTTFLAGFSAGLGLNILILWYTKRMDSRTRARAMSLIDEEVYRLRRLRMAMSRDPAVEKSARAMSILRHTEEMIQYMTDIRDGRIALKYKELIRRSEEYSRTLAGKDDGAGS